MEFLLYTILDKWDETDRLLFFSFFQHCFAGSESKPYMILNLRPPYITIKSHTGLLNHWIRSLVPIGFLRQCILDSPMLLPGNSSFACFYAPPLNSFVSFPFTFLCLFMPFIFFIFLWSTRGVSLVPMYSSIVVRKLDLRSS